MPNPIKYSTGSESLALKKGNFYIGTGDVGKGFSDDTGYYQGPSPDSCGYVVYLNKPGFPGDLSYHSALNDSQLISFTNNFEGQSFTSATECLVYYNGQSNRMVLNRDYEGIITDGLILNLDAGFLPSYPRSGTTWNDVIGTNNATLTNGPTFSLDDGGNIVFDGVNDYAETGGVTPFGTNPFTISMWFKTDGSQASGASLLCVANTASSTNWELSFSSNTLVFFTNASSFIPTTHTSNDNWVNVVVVRNSTTTDGLKIYINGILRGEGTASTNFSDSSGIRIGMNRASNAFFKGQVANILAYNRALSEEEILQNYNVAKKSPTYRVRFFDIDGTILKEEYLDASHDATAPSNPDIDPTYLDFAEWNQPFTNVKSDLDVGAMYDTVDGKTYIFARITDTTGLQPTFSLNKTTADLLTIDWGDSTTSTTSTNGNVNVQKGASYSAIGDYVISIDCAGEYRNNGVLFTTAPYREMVLKVYMGSNMTIQSLCFQFFSFLKTISIQKNIVFSSSQTFVFDGCSKLVHCNIPKNSTSLGSTTSFFGFLSRCGRLQSVSYPPSVTQLGAYAFDSCSLLEKINLSNITSIFINCFNGCGAISDFIIPPSITSIPDSAFANSRISISFAAGSTLTSIANNAFSRFGGGAFISKDGKIEFPASLTSIGSEAFQNCNTILEWTFLSTTPPTLANTNAFSGINAASKIYVPDASVATYKAATNWVTYADYIYPLSTRPCK